MFCSISGEIPQEPVVSKKCGILFEKRLIEKFVEAEGKCPVTGEALSMSDLIPVKANKAIRPRPVSNSSLPGMIATFQNEWDEVMLETFTLRQHLETARQELAQSLYQHDAACRVAARLMKERDEARHALASLQAQGFGSTAPSNSATGMDVESNETANGNVEKPSADETDPYTVGPLPGAVLDVLNEKCQELSVGRKGRKVSSEQQATLKDQFKSMTETASYTPHKADAKNGVTCLSTHSSFWLPSALLSAASESSTKKKGKRGSEVLEPSSSEEGSEVEVMLTGSIDKNAVLTEVSSGRVLTRLVGHKGKITATSFVKSVPAKKSVVATAASDSTVKIWTAGASDNSFTADWTYSDHTQSVTDITCQPTGDFLISASLDGSWHFLDLNESKCLRRVTNADSSYHSCQLHPDGLILGTGTAAGELKIWDVRAQNNVANLTAEEGAGAPVLSVSFSENGYLAVSGSADGFVRLWDLRKLQCTKSEKLGGSSVAAVAFDPSGAFFAAGGGPGAGGGYVVKAVKDFSNNVMEQASAHSKPITGLSWLAAASAEGSSRLLSSGMDRAVKVWTAAA